MRAAHKSRVKLAVALVALAGLSGGLTTSSRGSASPEVAQRLQETTKDHAQQQAEVRQLLTGAIADAVSSQDINRFLDSFTKAVRQKLVDNLNPDDVERFKNNAKAFGDKWQEQYGKPFAASDADAAFQNVTIDFQKRDDRELAIVTVVNPETQQRYYLHAVKQGAGWRLLLPARETGKYFASNLAGVLQTLSQEKFPRSTDNGTSMVVTRFYRTCSYHDEAADTTDPK